MGDLHDTRRSASSSPEDVSLGRGDALTPRRPTRRARSSPPRCRWTTSSASASGGARSSGATSSVPTTRSPTSSRARSSSPTTTARCPRGRPGDILITPKGSKGYWKNLTPVKKVWGIYEEADVGLDRVHRPRGVLRAAARLARRAARPNAGRAPRTVQRTVTVKARGAAAAVVVRHAQRDGAAAAARTRVAV